MIGGIAAVADLAVEAAAGLAGAALPGEEPAPPVAGPESSGMTIVADAPGSRIGSCPKFTEPSALTELPTHTFSALALTNVTVCPAAA